MRSCKCTNHDLYAGGCQWQWKVCVRDTMVSVCMSGWVCVCVSFQFLSFIKSGGFLTAPGRTFRVLILTFRSVWYLRKYCSTPSVPPLGIGMMLLYYTFPPTWHVVVRLPSSLDSILFTVPVVKLKLRVCLRLECEAAPSSIDRCVYWHSNN